MFLFNDLLVITKPLITHGVTATLDMKFIVKSIVPLDKLRIHDLVFDSSPVEKRPKQEVAHFVQDFATNPTLACKKLVEESFPKPNVVGLASLLWETPALDKLQLGNLLAGNGRILRAFVARYNFAALEIDEALRIFLLSIRLPDHSAASEALLRGFARGYFEANRDRLSFTRELTEEIVLWIMRTNDTLYGMYGFALPNPSVSPTSALMAFQPNDLHGMVAPSFLSAVYSSLKDAPVLQALSPEKEKKFSREVVLEPKVLPSRLTYNAWSEPITVWIPEPDEAFQIRLVGDGLEFDPPVLDFKRTERQSFRVKGRSLGSSTILFDRISENA